MVIFIPWDQIPGKKSTPKKQFQVFHFLHDYAGNPGRGFEHVKIFQSFKQKNDANQPTNQPTE